MNQAASWWSSVPYLLNVRDWAGHGPVARLWLRQCFGAPIYFGVRLFGDKLNLPVPPMSLILMGRTPADLMGRTPRDTGEQKGDEDFQTAVGRDAAFLTRNKTGSIVEPSLSDHAVSRLFIRVHFQFLKTGATF